MQACREKSSAAATSTDADGDGASSSDATTSADAETSTDDETTSSTTGDGDGDGDGDLQSCIAEAKATLEVCASACPEERCPHEACRHDCLGDYYPAFGDCYAEYAPEQWTLDWACIGACDDDSSSCFATGESCVASDCDFQELNCRAECWDCHTGVVVFEYAQSCTLELSEPPSSALATWAFLLESADVSEVFGSISSDPNEACFLGGTAAHWEPDTYGSIQLCPDVCEAFAADGSIRLAYQGLPCE